MKNVKHLIILAFCASIILVGKFILIMIPNVEIVTFLLIIYTLVFGFKKAFLIAIVYTVIEIILWPPGTHLYIWSFIVILTFLFRNLFKRNFLIWGLYSGFLGLSFGFLSSIPYILIANLNYAVVYFINGLLFDIIHMISNYFIMLLLGEITFNQLKKLINKTKIGGIV